MNFIDLHCDTLYKATTNRLRLDDPSYEVKLSSDISSHKLQCYAIWIPDNLSGEESERLFFDSAKLLKSESKRLGLKLFDIGTYRSGEFYNYVNSAFFTVENGKALNGKIENVKKFADLGVRIITLTWNDKNALGSGVLSGESNGITDFGRKVISKMEKYGIICDVSHASDALFYDIADISSQPFVATHSNTRKITSNPRNLTDEQIKIIKERKGIIGINLHNAFLNNNPDNAKMTDILSHTDYMLSLGCENVLSFGTDFDGCDLPKDIFGSESVGKIYELFLRHNYNETLVRKIFHENAHKFFENFDNRRIM